MFKKKKIFGLNPLKSFVDDIHKEHVIREHVLTAIKYLATCNSSRECFRGILFFTNSSFTSTSISLLPSFLPSRVDTFPIYPSLPIAAYKSPARHTSQMKLSNPSKSTITHAIHNMHTKQAKHPPRPPPPPSRMPSS